MTMGVVRGIKNFFVPLCQDKKDNKPKRFNMNYKLSVLLCFLVREVELNHRGYITMNQHKTS